MKNPMRDAIKNRRIQMVQGREMMNVDPLEQEQDAILKRQEPKESAPNETDENDDEESASVVDDEYNGAESPSPPNPDSDSLELTPDEVARVKILLAKMANQNPDADDEPTSIQDRMLLEQYQKQRG